MKKVNNLSELIDLVGKETVDKCFTEYMMITVAKAQKLDDLQAYIEPFVKKSSGETDLRVGDLITILEAPLFAGTQED